MARQGYGKLSNGFHSNTKVLKLQRMRPSALGVYCMAISFCSDVLNDGVMSEDDVIYQLNATEEDIEALIKVGMFERSDDGSYRIHDYLSHQSSRGGDEGGGCSQPQAQAAFRSRCHTRVTLGRNECHKHVTP